MKQNIIALGFFDGVHLGHGALFERTKELGGTPQVLTFDRHPSALLKTASVPLITSVEDRRWLISRYYGIEKVIVCSFEEIMGMQWQDFIHYLQNDLAITHIVAGHDFRFGVRGEGTPEKLQDLCRELGMGCDILAPVVQDGVVVSSTHIRKLIASGELEQANQFLGHPHVISNQVVHGNKIGNTLGFPTVNLHLPEGVLPPAFGVYACRVYVEDKVFVGATNVGIRPTVDESATPSVETFLLDYHDEELYDRHLRVEFHQFIRPERKFADFSALSTQIAKDVASTRDYFELSH